MKKKFTVLLVAVFVLAMTAMSFPKKANAVPDFAQKYHFSCAVCHTVFPNLNPFGRAFWRNGFRLPGTNGTPADSTQITEGISLPNPWPIPIMIGATIGYQHYTNENVNPQTDAFQIEAAPIVAAGAFKVYTPFANSISFYVHFELGKGPGTPSYALGLDQAVASINGLGSGFGIAPHLFNLKVGQVKTASPYFYRQNPFGYSGSIGGGPAANGQNLQIGYDGEAGNLIAARNPGIALYGTPGYHLWYKVSVTNDVGGNTFNANNANASNAMEYSYELKEYAPTTMGQLEFGYYGASIGEPMPAVTGYNAGWTNRVQVNGIDADLANNLYEIGLTYMQQNDSQPYGPSGITYNGSTQTSNGYSMFDVYGRYLLPQVGNGLMLMAEYATYSWTHKDAQEAYNLTYGTSCSNANLYGTGYLSNGCNTDGVKDDVLLQAEYNLSLNAHLFINYSFANNDQANTWGAGLDMAF